jgi:predicted nucleic acid-binding Zn finger protein
MVATHILATVEVGRLQKAVEGFVSGAYRIVLAAQTEAELRGFVTNGDGKEYGVVLSTDHSFCSCPDAMYRKLVCKHQVVLALHVIRTPQTEATRKEEPQYDLRLVQTRTGYACAA